jgi:HPt (histidine-containing phosphotransfer) domain-containing protein
MKTDLTYLTNMSGGNKSVMKEMIDIFCEQVKEISDNMNVSLAESDWLSLSRLAHKAKSSVAIMGMAEMESDLKKLERYAAEQKDVHTYKGLVEKFDSECKVAIEELKDFLVTVK